MADWRVYAFDMDGKGGFTLNDGDVRASVQPMRELSGGGTVSLTLKPEQDVTLTPWKTLIVVTLDGSIRGSGIVETMADDGDGSLTVTCVGVTTYYAGFPAEMEREYANADPARIIHDLITWAKARGGTDTGLDLSKYEDTGVRVGLPEDTRGMPTFNRKEPTLRPIPPEPKKGPEYNSTDPAKRKAARDAYSAAMTAWRTQRDNIRRDNSAKTKDYNSAKKAHERDLKAWLKDYEDAKIKVNWWENQTLGQTIDEMAKHVEYIVTPGWNGDTPQHTLKVAKRIGARRPQLRFVVGENVINSPPVDWAGESYATRVVFLGAGEGRDTIRGSAEGSRNGLARTVYISDKSVQSKTLADQRAARALKWRQSMPQVSELIVMDDDNAPFGTFDVGDEIRLIDPSGRWAGAIDMWVRILSITESSESPTAALTVTRSDKGE